jgi:hypothetical protein
MDYDKTLILEGKYQRNKTTEINETYKDKIIFICG